MAARCGAEATPTSPSAATRPDFFAAAESPFLRSQSIAASRSPAVSFSARLQSIMPAPVFSRRSLTRAAVISAISTLPNILQSNAGALAPGKPQVLRKRCAGHLPATDAPIFLDKPLSLTRQGRSGAGLFLGGGFRGDFLGSTEILFRQHLGLAQILFRELLGFADIDAGGGQLGLNAREHGARHQVAIGLDRADRVVI